MGLGQKQEKAERSVQRLDFSCSTELVPVVQRALRIIVKRLFEVLPAILNL